jgi:hypothetical protein
LCDNGSQKQPGIAYIPAVPFRPIDLPPDVAHAFAEDMRAYFKVTNGIKRDEIAARQAWLLERYVKGKLRTNDVKELFETMKDHA